MGHRHHHRPQLQQEHGHIFGSSSGTDVIIALVAAQGTQINMALVVARPPDTNMVSDLRWLSISWATTQVVVATGSIDINPNPKYCWVTDPDIIHGSSLGQDDTMVPCGNTDLHSPGGGTVLRHQRGHRL